MPIESSANFSKFRSLHYYLRFWMTSIINPVYVRISALTHSVNGVKVSTEFFTVMKKLNQNWSLTSLCATE